METRVIPELQPRLKTCDTCGNRIVEFGEFPEISYICYECLNGRK